MIRIYIPFSLLLMMPMFRGQWKPQDGGWSEWTYGTCSKSCRDAPKRDKNGKWIEGHYGSREDVRTCTNPRPAGGGQLCYDGRGKRLKIQKLRRLCAGSDPKNTFGVLCPIDGEWSNWMPWGNCSTPCGVKGIRKRTRECDNPYPQLMGKTCVGALTETKPCNGELPGGGACPSEHEKEWTDLTPCSKTCGGGRKTMEKRCKPNQLGCTPLRKQVNCSDFMCPIDGNYTEWSDWGPCSTTCGPGLSERTRSCTNPSPKGDGRECEEMPFEEKRCNLKPCPVDGKFSEWSEFTPCSVTCGLGTRNRIRTCDSPKPQHGGAPCNGSFTDEEVCFKEFCPVNGGFTEWSDPSPCSVTCGTGTRIRKRSCASPFPTDGGVECTGALTIMEKCHTNVSCDGGGILSQWSKWSSCSEPCGYGTEERFRTCNSATGGGGSGGEGGRKGKEETRQRKRRNSAEPEDDVTKCIGALRVDRLCFERPCPVDGGFTEWSVFTECSGKCGIGEQWYVRMCTQPVPQHGGKYCEGDITKPMPCDLKPCDASQWTRWSGWSVCKHTKVCDHGVSTRERKCHVVKGEQCTGESITMKKCPSNCTTPPGGAPAVGKSKQDDSENTKMVIVCSIVGGMLALFFSLWLWANLRNCSSRDKKHTTMNYYKDKKSKR